MKKAIWIVITAMVLVSCGKETKFTIEGKVSGTKDETMYFEHVGLSKVAILDSVKLKGNGTFKFRQPRPAEPDFYRLRLKDQWINIAVDSTETINIQADVAAFAQNYTVTGSGECLKIKEMTLLQLKTSEDFNKLQQSYNTQKISADEYMAQLKTIIDSYKTVARQSIYENPKSTSAYFALFQQINNMLIFDPYDKEDYKAFGAVATSWHQYHPEGHRSKQLYNLAMQSLKVTRGERPVEYVVEDSKSHFQIELPDVKGDMISLSEVSKGKVMLLEFTAYQMQSSPIHNIQLSEAYNKYKANGFEIFQVSLDSDEHLWKNAASNLPWICVRDPQSVNSKIAQTYNVKEIPTGFILNRSGEIVKRIESYGSIEKDIAAYLK